MSWDSIRTMDRLVDTIALGAVRNGAQTGTGQQANAAGNHTGLVADDVTKQIAGYHHAVEATRVLDHDHGSTVDELVLDRQIREFFFKRLIHDLAPQTASSKDIGLVQRPDLGLATAASQEASQASHTLNLSSGIGLCVPGIAGSIVFFALTKIEATRELSNNDKVCAAAHLGPERRVLDESFGSEEARAEVSVRAHLLSQPQQALLWTNSTGTPFGASNGTEENGVGGIGSGESFVC